MIHLLNQALADVDNTPEPIDESDVLRALENLKAIGDSPEPPLEWIAEIMAFSFYEDTTGKKTVWGTYFGPRFTFTNDQNQEVYSPSISQITKDIVQYWVSRASSARNPVLRARYADLVWDLSFKAINEQPDYRIARIAIDSYVEISQSGAYKRPVNVKWKLQRALSLALSLKDSNRIIKVVDAIIRFEDAISNDSKLGLWGFSYDYLVGNCKVPLTGEQELKVITDLEGHLERDLHPPADKKVDPWAVEAAALRLASYYKKQQKPADVKRVLLNYGEAFVQACVPTSDLQASGWLERVHSTYIGYGLTEEAEQIVCKLRDLGPSMTAELKPISHTFEVDPEKMHEYVSALSEGPFEAALRRITAHYIPKKQATIDQLKELSTVAPMLFHIPREIQDDRGRPVAKVGSLDDDLEGNIITQIAQNMSLSAFFLRMVIDNIIMINHNFENEFVDYICASPVYEKEKHLLIKLGISEYLKKNYIIAVHLLVPQIEAAVRTLYEKIGGAVLKLKSDGAFHLKTLDELLRDEKLISFFGEDISCYLRVLFTDQRGWNLRNKVCHGLVGGDGSWRPLADQILHALLCLAIVREKPKT